MMNQLKLIVFRDLLLATRSGGNWVQGSIFFILFIMLAAFSLGPDQAERGFIAPALVWLAVTFASQLSLGQLFSEDLNDGSLECWVTDNRSLSVYVIGKLFSHWISNFAPILLLSPFAAVMLGADTSSVPILMISLLVGGPAMVLIGAMASALTANLRGAGLLIVLISGPLLASPLIFGVGAVQAGVINSVAMKLLGAISLFSLVLSPVIARLALKIHLE